MMCCGYGQKERIIRLRISVNVQQILIFSVCSKETDIKIQLNRDLDKDGHHRRSYYNK